MAIAQLLAHLGDQLGGALGVGEREIARGVDLERHSGQRGAQPIVQIAAQPPSLGLAGRDERLPGADQIRGQCGCVGRQRQRGRQQIDGRAVGGGQSGAAGPGSDARVHPPARSGTSVRRSRCAGPCARRPLLDGPLSTVDRRPPEAPRTAGAVRR